MNNLLERIEKLEYHQKLLLNMIDANSHAFDVLIIKKNLSENEVNEFFSLCEELSKEFEEQKAENFVFFAPLFKQFTSRLHNHLHPKEVIKACLRQNIYPELMKVFEKNL